MAQGRVEPPFAESLRSMTDHQSVAWRNGEQIPYLDAAVPVWDLGVVAGATISEMARTYGHKPFRIEKHLARLLASCRELGFALPYSESVLAEAANDVVEANVRRIPDTSDLGIVWFVTAGANPVYLPENASLGPTVCVHTFELPSQQWQDAIRSGVRLTIPDQRQLPDEFFPVQHKTRNRLHWWLADRAANDSRSGTRALLLDQAGQITETSTACFYAVADGAVLTARNGVLRSTTRDFVQELCDRISIGFSRTDLPAERISDFPEAFLSSTPCGLLPVAAIDNHRLAGPEGPIVQRLQSEWTQLTGVDTFEQILRS